MLKLTKLQAETMEYCKKQIDEARKLTEDDLKKRKKDKQDISKIIDAQNGIVYTQGGDCTSRTLRALEKKGLLTILLDNSGVYEMF